MACAVECLKKAGKVLSQCCRSSGKEEGGGGGEAHVDERVKRREHEAKGRKPEVG